MNMNNIDVNNVDALFSEWDKPDSPGCALAVIKDKEIVYKRGYGCANLEYNIPITATSVFEIASASKQFTALCILLLSKQGKLSLDDNIKKFIPEFNQIDEQVSINHLIHHTSGIRDYLPLMMLSGKRCENDYPDTEIIDLICRQKELNNKPGDGYMYSNSNYVLLREIISRISGTSLRNFADEWIFSPLGMNHTHFHDNFAEIIPGRATGYTQKDGDEYQICMSNFNTVGNAGIYTTVEDLALFDNNFYQNILGGYGNDLMEEFITPGKLNNGVLLNYAFGFEIGKYHGLRLFSHPGWWMGYKSGMIRFPDEKLSVICLANCDAIDPSVLAIRTADLYLSIDKKEHVLKHKEIKINPDVLDRYIGEYEFTPEFIITITKGSNRLITQVAGQGMMEIYPESETKFFAKDINIQISFPEEESSKATKLNLHREDRDMMAKRIETQPYDVDFDQYTGDYYSEDLGVIYNISAKEGRLIFHHKWHNEVSLMPIGKDQLSNYSWRIRNIKPQDFIWHMQNVKFIRNKNNKITGFAISNDRIRNLKFTKKKI